MVATAPSTLAGPPAQGCSASRSAFDRRGATEVLPENPVFDHLAARSSDRAGATCIGRPRPHHQDSHPGRPRFSGHTRVGRYCRARYYHPTLQRFISEDPIGFAGGDFNLYGYVGNDPFNYRDPLGLDKKRAQSCSGSFPMAPPGVDVDANIREAARRYNPMWFYRQVRNRGPWDYKQRGKGLELGGKYNPYEAFGNFHFGATGAAFGFPDQVLLRGAGYAQWRAGTSLPEYGSPLDLFPPYGDDPWDQHWVQAGINYYRCTHGIAGYDPGVPPFDAFP